MKMAFTFVPEWQCVKWHAENINDDDLALYYFLLKIITFVIKCQFIAGKKTSSEMMGDVGCSVPF